MNATALFDLVGPWIVLAIMLCGPVLLAWWLSDGFADLLRGDGAVRPLEVRALPKPSDHGVEVVNVDSFTGFPTRLPS